MHLHKLSVLGFYFLVFLKFSNEMVDYMVSNVSEKWMKDGKDLRISPSPGACQSTGPVGVVISWCLLVSMCRVQQPKTIETRVMERNGNLEKREEEKEEKGQ